MSTKLLSRQQTFDQKVIQNPIVKLAINDLITRSKKTDKVLEHFPKKFEDISTIDTSDSRKDSCSTVSYEIQIPENVKENPENKEVYFRKYEKPVTYTKNTTKGAIEIVTQVLDDWKDIPQDKINSASISGHGGSKTYLVTAFKDDESNKKEVVVHDRRIVEEDPITELRMAASQKVLWEHGVAVPRIISGKNWYIEPYVKNCVNKDKEIDNSQMARLLADIHKVPTEWFEPYRKELVEIYPHLAECRKGSHVWCFTTRLEWYNSFKKSWKFFQDAGFKPLSLAARRYVTVHSDFHGGNR